MMQYTDSMFSPSFTAGQNVIKDPAPVRDDRQPALTPSVEAVRREYIGERYVLCDEVHRFGTDALLLARFASPRPQDYACDLGSGCGVIPIAWLCLNGPKQCDAVELQPGAHRLLRNAVARQGLSDRIFPHCADLRRLEEVLPAGKYDLVAINPPYYPVGSGKPSASPALRAAREEGFCTLDDAATAAARLLRVGGRFCLCHRPERLCDVVTALRKADLEPKRMRLVSHRQKAPPFLVLVEGRRGGRPSLTVEDTLYLEEHPDILSPFFTNHAKGAVDTE